MNNKSFVTPFDVIEVAHQVLDHRMILNYKADAKGIKTKDIINKIIEVTKAP